MKAEYRLHCAVNDWLDRCLVGLPVWWETVDYGIKLAQSTWARLTRIGVRVGRPDITIYHAGRAYFVELKAPDGDVSGVQIVTHASIRRAGCSVAIVRSTLELRAHLDLWGIPHREHVPRETASEMRAAS